jgi:hypothetical protein
MDRADTIRRVAKEIQLEHSCSLGPVFYHGPLMLPFFRDGDLLIVTPVAFAEVHPGDIVTFRDAERFPTARVIEKHEDSLLMKSDNFPILREVSSADVLGRVVERHRGGRRVRRTSLSWRLHTQYTLLRARLSALRSRTFQGRTSNARNS